MASTLRPLYFMIIVYVPMISLALAQDENQFIYNGFQGVNLLLGGIAKIQSNGLLQLTNTSKQQLGNAFYQFPLRFNASSSTSAQSLSFSTNFVFAIVPEKNLGGHGMAFVISPSVDFSQALPFQYLGLFNSSNNGLSTNHILAIELDTILSPDIKDIDENHVGIDVNNLKSRESATATYFSNEEGKNRSLKLTSGEPIQVWIDYVEAEKLLNVTLAPIRGQKPNWPLLSTTIDLSEIFLDTMYVGFSAATGTLSSDHYILGWSFNRSGKAQSLEVSKLPPVPSRRKASRPLIIILVVVVVVVVLMTVAGAAYLLWRKKYEEVLEDWEMEYGPQRFSYKNLYKATNGFTDRQLLGAGGFGRVYRGVLPSSDEQIAVKKISHDSKQGMKEFVAEIVSMGRLRHRNLVRLLGYCRRKGELFLVYDCMPNGSLDKYLFGNEKPNLDWSQRFQIIRGVASALLYLHEEWEQVVLHRDVKASNVLLDANLNGRLGDFGLAKLYDHGTNPETTRMVGTFGYLAPELPRTCKATTCTDVFAFGAFMLSVACGKMPIAHHGQPEEIIFLVDWVIQCWKKGDILDASDPRLEGNYVVEEMELVLKLGLLCSHSIPAARPSMRQVMQCLDRDNDLPDIHPDSAGIGTVTVTNQASAFSILFPPSSGDSSAHSMSVTESFLKSGR